MIKSSIAALLAVVAFSSVAAPAFAATSLVEHTNDDGDQYISRSDVLARLHENGVNATSVENWNGLVRAFVRLDNGNEVQQFFDRDTLAPVTL